MITSERDFDGVGGGDLRRQTQHHSESAIGSPQVDPTELTLRAFYPAPNAGTPRAKPQCCVTSSLHARHSSKATQR